MRISLHYSCALLVLFLGINVVFGQKFNPKYLRENDATFLKFIRSTTNDGWLEFDSDNYPLEVTTFTTRFAKNLGITDGYELRLVSDKTDKQGVRHQQHHLFWKTLRVEGGHLDMHSKNGILILAHSRIIDNLDQAIEPLIEESQALEVALKELKLTKDISEQVAKSQLVLTNLDNDYSKENYHLAYTFDITALKFSDPYRVYIDARSGNPLKKVKLNYGCFTLNARAIKGDNLPKLSKGLSGKKTKTTSLLKPMTAGTFTNPYTRGTSNPTSFDIQQETSTKYHLNASGTVDTRYDFDQNGIFDDLPVNNSSSNWGTYEQGWTLSHWATWQSFLYFKNNFGINGPFNNGTITRVLHTYLQTNPVTGTPVIADWNPYGAVMRLALSPQNLGTSVATVDICGHEYGHGISGYLVSGGGWSTNLEPASLNEGFSDIIGNHMERVLYPSGGGTSDYKYWQVGEDIYFCRDMSNPHYFNDPQVYLESGYWGTEEHKNAGVLDKWFHTLVTGIGVTGSITPISSYNDAFNLVIYALDNYISGDYNYQNAANGLRIAAGQYFGECSPQQKAVIAAWAQAGITLANCSSSCDYNGISYTNSNVSCSQLLTLNVGCSSPGTGCSAVNYQFSGPNVGYNCCSSTLTVTTPSSPGYYTYTASMSKPGCYTLPYKFNVSVHCNGARLGAMEFGSEDKIISVYPSPAQAELTVQVNLKKAETIPLQIVDMQGKIHQKSQQKGVVGQNEWTLNIGQLIPGIYLLETRINQKREVRKFIKE
jgi:Zn-dependent metalloprotease